MITQTSATERAAATPRRFALDATVRGFLFPVLITGLVLAGALFGPSALTVGSTGAPAAGVRLDVGWGYVLMAPAANILDTLSVLALEQHYAVLATLLLGYLAWRVLRHRRGADDARGRRRLLIEAGVASASLLALLGFYAYGMVGPRPMSALVPADEDVLVLDVHSHTDHSHDSRRGFDAEDRREWHRSGGFHAVYVADHRTWDGYLEGASENPDRVGDGTVLLPAIEIKFAGLYTSALGEPAKYARAVEGNTLRRDSLRAVVRRTGVRPTLVLTIPGPLDGAVASTPDSIGFVAVEISDASPRGLRQGRRDRAALLRLADSLDLAPVAAANNHGWGRTVAAWTLMRIPGWRELSPEALGAAIEEKFHTERRHAAWVVERRAPWLGASPVDMAMSVPAIAWTMFGAMGPAERASWLVWTWALAFAAAFGITPWRRLARARRSRQPIR